MIKKNFLKNSFVLMALLSLPSCKWFANQTSMECSSCPSHATSSTTSTNSGATLLSMGNKTLLSEGDFENLITEITEANEQAKLMLQLIPDFREQFFKAKKQAIIISEWAKRNGIRNSDEYRKKEQRMMDAIKESLDSEEFVKRHPVDVSDADAQRYYDENKDKDPRIAAATSGVNAVGISFDDAAKASEFAKRVKTGGNKNFDSLAKEGKLKVTSFGVINNDSFIDKAVKDKALTLKNFPDVFTVKGENGKTWVVFAKNKEKAQYKKFEEVKATIKQMLKPKKLEEMVNTELPRLENEYKIVENSQYFENLRKKSQDDQMAQAQQMAQPEMPKAPKKELAAAKPTSVA